ncbi:hypothetical protein BpHYR1_041087 [Brachionus plicatilis]|uniref:Uncharacterized protein n=1 Tax=Brachionus plicatilis TaxID=10195 RepID=A0A3M7R5N7_BRAPC|nr:hypothetical protein BpHYR1_041087 [Brachionus plicatilis]
MKFSLDSTTTSKILLNNKNNIFFYNYGNCCSVNNNAFINTHTRLFFFPENQSPLYKNLEKERERERNKKRLIRHNVKCCWFTLAQRQMTMTFKSSGK